MTAEICSSSDQLRLAAATIQPRRSRCPRHYGSGPANGLHQLPQLLVSNTLVRRLITLAKEPPSAPRRFRPITRTRAQRQASANQHQTNEHTHESQNSQHSPHHHEPALTNQVPRSGRSKRQLRTYYRLMVRFTRSMGGPAIHSGHPHSFPPTPGGSNPRPPPSGHLIGQPQSVLRLGV
jgi:hypothetical protein